MPRYFFHVHDGKDYTDREGVELPDAKSAREEAIRAAGGMLRDMSSRFATEEWRMNVTDRDGRPVLTLQFRVEDHL